MKSEQVPRTGWIRAIRDALGISQSQLAARAGLTTQQWLMLLQIAGGGLIVCGVVVTSLDRQGGSG